MLLNFEVENYKSFQKNAVFTMEPAPKQHGLDYSILTEKIKRKKVKKSASEIICLGFFFVVILLWCVSFIYMGIWAFMNSLKNYFQFYDDTLGLPKLPLL